MYRILISFLILISFFNESFNAQKNKKACSSIEYHQFDFWVGNWDVYDTNNNLIGTNHIVKVPNACAIQENWDSKKSSNQGTSYNYYNQADKKWHQVWIDNSGFVLNLSGNLIDGKMILQSELIKNSKQNYYNRITWFKNEDHSVWQIWDYVSEDGKVIKHAFKGLYKKKSTKG